MRFKRRKDRSMREESIQTCYTTISGQKLVIILRAIRQTENYGLYHNENNNGCPKPEEQNSQHKQ